MVFDETKLVDWQDEEGKEILPDQLEWDEAWDAFEEYVVREIFKAERITGRAQWRNTDRDERRIGETDRFYIGINSGGGAPCLYLESKTWGRYHCENCGPDDSGWYEDVPYVLNQDAKKFFNRLIRAYPDGFFSFPTTAWTSLPYGRLRKGGKIFVRYTRTA